MKKTSISNANNLRDQQRLKQSSNGMETNVWLAWELEWE